MSRDLPMLHAKNLLVLAGFLGFSAVASANQIDKDGIIRNYDGSLATMTQKLAITNYPGSSAEQELNLPQKCKFSVKAEGNCPYPGYEGLLRQWKVTYVALNRKSELETVDLATIGTVVGQWCTNWANISDQKQKKLLKDYVQGAGACTVLTE